MKNQALLSLKDNSKILKCRLLQFLFGALKVNDKWKCLLSISALSHIQPVRNCPFHDQDGNHGMTG